TLGDPGAEDRAEPSGPAPAPPGPPSLPELAAAALTVGIASGLLELAVVMFQIHGLHRVGLSTLRISRHVAWVIPAAEAVTALILAVGLVAPALAWSAWRRWRRGPSASTWVWAWAGLVLGTLLFLAPILAIRRLHGGAALALAIGAGSRVRGLLIRPTPDW